MELDYCGEMQIDNPSTEQVFEYLTQLTADAGSFLILVRQEQFYLQTYKSDEGYYVEFREGAEDKHYCSVRNDLAFDEVKTIFEKYYNGDESFQTLVEFKNLDFGGKSGCLGALLLFPWLCLMR